MGNIQSPHGSGMEDTCLVVELYSLDDELCSVQFWNLMIGFCLTEFGTDSVVIKIVFKIWNDKPYLFTLLNLTARFDPQVCPFLYSFLGLSSVRPCIICFSGQPPSFFFFF